MKTRVIVIAIVAIAVIAIAGLTAAALLLQPHGSKTTSSSSSGLTTTTTTRATPTFTVALVNSSTNNDCFVNSYNDTIVVDNAIYYGCSARLLGNQSIKQNVFRSTPLYGNYSLSINSTQSLTLTVVENGVTVYTGSGGSISYKGQIGQNEPMYVVVKNSERTSTDYSLEVDFPNVSIS
jgi:hypothetical protein